jgi:ApbE superfamily uncharacterized protein (UPF0280 family)
MVDPVRISPEVGFGLPGRRVLVTGIATLGTDTLGNLIGKEREIARSLSSTRAASFSSGNADTVFIKGANTADIAATERTILAISAYENEYPRNERDLSN